MEKRDYIVVLAALFMSAAVGFAGNQTFFSDQNFSKSMDVRVDNENRKEMARFDNQSLQLRYENFEEAKYYYGFNDSRGVQQIEDLEHDGEIHTFRDIKSFGDKTYFLYLRYQDNASEFDDGWMELYRIEGT
jgi:hypothetical protein